jgi:hypothetical protein
MAGSFRTRVPITLQHWAQDDTVPRREGGMVVRGERDYSAAETAGSKGPERLEE